MNDSPVRFGLIGTGNAARVYYAPAFQRTSEATLLACCDPRPDRGRSFAMQMGCDYHDSIEDMLARSDIEAVIIASQVQSHAETTIAACVAGKHVLCEKPMANSLEEADAMIAAANKAGVVLGGVFQMRFSNHFSFLRDLVVHGRLGRIQTVDIVLRREFRADLRKTRPDLPGFLLNILSHDIDFAVGLFGPISEVEFSKVEYMHPLLQPPFEDMAVAVWRFASGTRGTLNMCCSGAMAEPAERSMSVIGESGAAALRDLSLEAIAEIDQNGATRPLQIPPLIAEGHEGQLRDFAKALRCGYSPAISGEQHRESLRIALEILSKGDGFSTIAVR